MTRLNAEILGHTGSTDVITLDYSLRPRHLYRRNFRLH